MSMATDPVASLLNYSVPSSGDHELDAMRLISIALDQLNDGAQRRAIRWAADRYGVELDQASDPA